MRDIYGYSAQWFQKSKNVTVKNRPLVRSAVLLRSLTCSATLHFALLAHSLCRSLRSLVCSLVGKWRCTNEITIKMKFWTILNHCAAFFGVHVEGIWKQIWIQCHLLYKGIFGAFARRALCQHYRQLLSNLFHSLIILRFSVKKKITYSLLALLLSI